MKITQHAWIYISQLLRVVLKTKAADTGPRGYKTFFMLNSTEHKISTAHEH